MGGEHSQQTSFRREDWQLTERNNAYSVYRNRTQTSLHIEEHEKFTTDDVEYKFQKDIFQLRAHNPFLVAGAFFESGEEHQFCSTSYKYRLFIQKIPIRLSDVQHIPFPDFIHLYNQALNGFSLLAQRLGSYFEIEEPYIGINERGVVKVWLSKYFAHNRMIGGRITQEQMVKSIVDIIDRNVDPFHGGKNIPTVRNYLYRNADTLRFDQALGELQGYVNAFNGGIVPQRLQCVEQVGGVYAIANRSSIYHQEDDLVDQNIFRPEGGQSSRVEITSSRPQLVSQQNLAYYQSPQMHLSRFQQQSTEFNPRSFAATPEFKLKESAIVPREHVILNPNDVRENMSVIRRRKSEYQQQNSSFGFNPQGNSMKYSQILPLSTPIQTRPITFNRNQPINSAIVPQVNTSPPTSSFLPSNQAIRNPLVLQNYGSPRKFGGQSSNQITFKIINPNAASNQPISVAGQPSIANFSPGPSQYNTHRVMVSTSNEISEKLRVDNQPEIAGSAPAIPVRISPNESNRMINIGSTSNPSIEMMRNQNVEKIVNYREGSSNGNSVRIELPKMQEKRVVETVQVQRLKQVKHIEPIVAEKRVIQNKIQKEVELKMNAAKFEPVILKSDAQSYNFASANKYEYKNTSNGFTQTNNNNFAYSNVQQYIPQKNSLEKPKSNLISADDGKSSQEFMRKLLQINRTVTSQQKISSYKTQPAYAAQYDQQTNYQKDSNSIPSSNYNRYSEYNSEIPLHSNVKANDQQFGRNAVSNIIDTQQGSYIKNNPYSFGSNQPLKFQQNLTLKYSRLAQETQPYQAKTSYGKYQFDVDPQLLADLNKIPK